MYLAGPLSPDNQDALIILQHFSNGVLVSIYPDEAACQDGTFRPLTPMATGPVIGIIA